MLEVGQRAIVALTHVNCATRHISVRAGAHGYNVLDYGVSALENDFDDVILLRAALEDACTKKEVLQACAKYKRHATVQCALVCA